MTPSEIEEMARRRYNAVGDTNWSSQELIDLMYAASLELCRDCGILIEKKFTSTTVAGTQEYDFPENAKSIKRITYAGRKLKLYTMRDDDTQTLENQATTDTGTPEFYYVWNRILHLRPIPDDAQTLEVFAICDEQPLTTLSNIDLPERFHPALVNYLVKEMSAKDLNWSMYDRFKGNWDEDKLQIRATLKREKRADAFNQVKDERFMPYTTLGPK